VTLTLDHVFVCPEDAAAAESALAGFGLQFARRGVHRGQGTANACVFFDNAYLELLWRDNDDELQSKTVRPVALWERVRWRESGASPFGIALRPGTDPVPVETWAYEAPFLPAGSKIPIVTPPFMPQEPLVFLSMLPFEQRPPLEQRGARRTLTGVTVCGPQLSRLSRGLRALCELDVFRTRQAAEPLLELDWDGAHSNGFHDFRPTLPLVLRW
jgi:glyoxalase-like protein